MISDDDWMKTFGWYCCGAAAIATLVGLMLLMVMLGGCASTSHRTEPVAMRHGPACSVHDPRCT